MKKLIFLSILTLSVFAQKGSTKLAEYVGVYKMESFFEKCTITEKDGDLYAEVDANGVNKLIMQEKVDVFKSTSSYGTIFTFFRNDKKEVVSISMKLMDNEVAGQKIN